MSIRRLNNPRNAKLTIQTCACGCGEQFEARTADVNRGWGKYFSKSCKAKHQVALKPKLLTEEQIHDEACAAQEMGWDGHKDGF